MALIIILGVALLVIVLIYNSLIGKKNEVQNAFGGMDAQLKKRYDLIPNLVSAVKQYMQHERGVLEKITALRTRALSSAGMDPDEKVDLDNQISTALKGIQIAVENYPDLKSNTNFINLQRTLNEVESQISAARRTYNAAVTSYNNAVEMFPSSIFAGFLKYQRKKVFEIPEQERQNVNVGQLFSNS